MADDLLLRRRPGDQGQRAAGVRVDAGAAEDAEDDEARGERDDPLGDERAARRADEVEADAPGLLRAAGQHLRADPPLVRGGVETKRARVVLLALQPTDHADLARPGRDRTGEIGERQQRERGDEDSQELPHGFTSR